MEEPELRQPRFIKTGEVQSKSPDQSSGDKEQEPTGIERANKLYNRIKDTPFKEGIQALREPEPVKEVKGPDQSSGETSGSDYLSEKLKKVNAKEVEKYLKSYRVPFKDRGDFTTKFPKGNYVKYLNDLIKNDPEFWKYHNVVKKK